MVYSGHGTARLDQVRFGGLAASCGGLAVEARAVRFALVPRGSVSYGGRGSVRFGSVGQACWVSVRRSG